MNIVLFGDACTDVWIECEAKRLAPEAPVPVLVPIRRTENPGMGGNVYENLKSLAPIGSWITANLPLGDNKKTRYVDSVTGHHFFRVDDHADSSERLDSTGIKYKTLMENPPDAVVISDYCKGFLSEWTLKTISEMCRENLIPLFVDTKRYLGAWSNGAFVKVNEHEYETLKGQMTFPHLLCENLIVTMGSKGMSLLNHAGCVEYYSPAVGQVEVKDGAGCGDSVLAALVVRYLENGKDLKDAMDWANKVGAIAVSKRGVVAVRREDVK